MGKRSKKLNPQNQVAWCGILTYHTIVLSLNCDSTRLLLLKTTSGWLAELSWFHLAGACFWSVLEDSYVLIKGTMPESLKKRGDSIFTGFLHFPGHRSMQERHKNNYIPLLNLSLLCFTL